MQPVNSNGIDRLLLLKKTLHHTNDLFLGGGPVGEYLRRPDRCPQEDFDQVFHQRQPKNIFIDHVTN